MSVVLPLFPEEIAVDLPIVDECNRIFCALDKMPLPDKVAAVNAIRRALHAHSPFKGEPVDLVQWIQSDSVVANDYNPNSVAPPEMKLLQHSIAEDGYTQPIVAWKNDAAYEVVDGFHRNRVGKECADVRKRVHGYLPVTVANEWRTDKADRIASTIRHNRARGKHKVEAMSDIVIELKRRNWNDEKIARELGMDPDEVLRLSQISGLAEAFKDQAFSEAWDIGDAAGVGAEILSDVCTDEPDNSGRVYHTWEKWECYRHGFYDERPPNGMTQEEGEQKYQEFLSDMAQFAAALETVITTWKYSCEHYLTNERMNRIAWLGQASMACAHRIPSCCRGGYNRLTDSQKEAADSLALQYLNKWLVANGRPALEMDQARSKTQAELY